MTLSFGLFLIAAAFLAYVLAYGCIFLGLAIAGRRARTPPALGDDTPSHEGVAVVVPSHFEGAALADTVRTLMAQDYPGFIEIVVLLHAASDPSFVALVDAFPGAHTDDGDVHTLQDSQTRRLKVALTGAISKRDKLNAWLSRVELPLVAFLDADHRADVSWIRSAVATLGETGAAGVQGRRRPLAASALTQIWDSAQNHVGSEAVNAYRRSAGLPAFFTGTTAVFRTSILARRRFADCLAEDTYLTMELVLEGHSIAYDDRAGSYEEVAPTLASYIARRRRWSAGHDQAFLSHARRVFASQQMPGRNKRHLLLIGQFYFVPLAVMAFLYAQGVYFFLQFTVDVRAFVAIWAFVLALPIALFVSRGRGTWGSDLVVSWAMLLPQVAMVGALAYRLTGREDYYYILTFPFAKPIGIVQLATFSIPWLTILAGWSRTRALRPWQLAVAIVTFPFSVFFDILASLLGFSDLARGRTVWTRIARGDEVSTAAVPESVSVLLRAARRRVEPWGRYAAVVAVFLAAVAANDLLAKNDCGRIEPFFLSPIIWKWSSPVTAHIETRQRASPSGSTQIEIRTTFALTRPGKVHLGYLIDGTLFAQHDVDETTGGVDVATTELPAHWGAHVVAVDVRAVSRACRCSERLPSRALEFQGSSVLVNGEPFLLKCIIPSFNSPKLSLDTNVGFSQLKEAGANAARYYHMPTPGTLAAAARHEMLLVDQPDESTWENVDLRDASERKTYLQRYDLLVKQTGASPYILLDNLGNELELLDHSNKMLTAIADTATTMRERGRRFPLGYSTYLTFRDYPVDVLGINMLDTGATYWSGAINLLQALRRPYYASELGGFVALVERVPPPLRVWRLDHQWNRILEAGAMGACIYESHDNWAQSVPGTVQNDPFTPEQPDDLRGLWDEQNRPKLELRFVERLFSDVAVAWDSEARVDGADRRAIVLTNRRSFALHGVELGPRESPAFPVGDLEPGESRRVVVPLAVLGGAGAPGRTVHLRYTTHGGLHEESAPWLAIATDLEHAVVLNDDFVQARATTDRVEGQLLLSDRLDVWLPPTWSGATLGGESLPGSGPVRSVPVPAGGPRTSVVDATISINGGPLVDLGAGVAHVPSGHVRLRFRIRDPAGKEAYLVLGGVEADTLHLTRPDGTETSHPARGYRDVVIPLPARGAAGEYEATFERRDAPYVNEHSTPDHHAILVDLEIPYVFAPVDVDLKRVGD